MTALNWPGNDEVKKFSNTVGSLTVFFYSFFLESAFFERPPGAENDHRKSHNKTSFLEFLTNFSF